MNTDSVDIAGVLIGEYVIVRTYSAGVHAGTLATRDGREAVLTDSRRIWYWEGAASLSQLAGDGPKRPEKCKFSVVVDTILLTEVIEVISTTPDGRKAIEAVPAWAIS